MPDNYAFTDYAYVEHNLPKVGGFKTGDLRVFNYEWDKFKRHKKVDFSEYIHDNNSRFSDYFMDGETYDHYGIMTLDGNN